ncbi:MAG: 7-cyano-7-deazaguanine synthase QueC [Nitrospirota bacterium]
MEKKAIVLLSGGIDSTTTMAIAREEGYKTYCLTFNYGQRHIIEVEKAKTIGIKMGCEEHIIINLDIDKIGGSALTSEKIPVPKDMFYNQREKFIPVTYVPARNTIFLSVALGWAEVIRTDTIFIGANILDYSGYPDCRPEYLNAFENMANLATRESVEGRIRFKIRSPLITLTKGEIIKRGISLGIDYSLTHSCYDPQENGRPCKRCDSCLIRKKGFEEAGITLSSE